REDVHATPDHLLPPLPPPPRSTLFPYTTLFRSPGFPVPRFKVIAKLTEITLETTGELVVVGCDLVGPQPCFQSTVTDAGREPRSDRKSTRLNSSHLVISYAVFCLKKKNVTSSSVSTSSSTTSTRLPSSAPPLASPALAAADACAAPPSSARRRVKDAPRPRPSPAP